MSSENTFPALNNEQPFYKTFQRATFYLFLITVLSSLLLRVFDLGKNIIPRKFSIASGVIVVFLASLHYLLSWYSVSSRDFPVLPKYVYLYLQIAVFLQFQSSILGHLRSMVWRVIVTYPSSWFTTFVMFQSGLLITIHKIFPRFFTVKRITLLTMCLMTFGLLLSIRPTRHDVEIKLGNKWKQNLKVIQISDVHLGPMMSVERLKDYANHVVEQNPDLVLITGDMYTIESHNEPKALAEGLQPLLKLKGKVFACLGNHDHEVPYTVSQLEEIGAKVLIDDKIIFETKYGKISIIGYDFVSPLHIAKHMENNLHLLDESEKIDYQFILLHNPNYFAYVPSSNDITRIVFSG